MPRSFGKQLLWKSLLMALWFVAAVSAASTATPYSGTIQYPASQPAAAGTRYPVPTLNSGDSTNWGWRCVVTNGPGLTFGGNSPFSADGCLHTRLLQGGQWTLIDSLLRARNPLQTFHTRAQTLRDRLKDAISLGRFIFFQGRSASDETAFLADSVNPELTAVATGISQLATDLQAQTGLSAYYAAQVAWSAPRFTAAAGNITTLGASVDSAELANLRTAQIAIEIAAEALDAEPAPRVLSMIAWDSASSLFVIFGGDHLDYQVNDLWVFDPAVPQWQQRHAGNGPCPRADHFFTPSDSGRIRLTGGYGGAAYSYNHVGPDIWYYDVAGNIWIQPNGVTAYPTDMRTYRSGGLAPEFLMSGTKPAAASNEALLAGIPSNAWVSMNPPVRGPGHRDWGTLAYDAEHDMIYTYSGGHVAYCGTDVLAYHIATNRYELPIVPEFPLGKDGNNEGPAGWTMTRRPWMPGHTWNGIEYHPKLKRMVLLSREQGSYDNNIYYYDPIRAEWTRETLTPGMSNSNYSSQACYTSLGMMSWFGSSIWLLNDTTLQWRKLDVTGTMPGTSVDNCGLVFDSKRNCIFFFTHSYGSLYDGSVYKLDLTSLAVTKIVPANAAFVAKAAPLREIVYLPNQDLILFAGTNGSHHNTLVFDPASNLWRSAAIPGSFVTSTFGVSSGLVYDTKRDLVWYIHNNYNSSYVVGDVSVLKIDLSTLVLDTIKADKPAYITIAPDSSIIAVSGSLKLTASLWCADSTPYTGNASWSVAAGGTVDSTGLFRSNGTIGICNVKATAKDDSTVSAASNVYVLDMVARLKFNEGTGTLVSDSIDSGLKGSFEGSAAWCSGHSDSGLCFAGWVTSPGRIVYRDSHIRFQDNFTLSFWAKPNAATPYSIWSDAYDRLLFPAGTGAYTWGDASAGAGIIVGNNRITVYERTSPYAASITPLQFDTTISDWTHITVAYTNKQPKLFINGILVKTGTVSTNPIVRPSLTMGGDYKSWYSGSVDEVTLFSRCLSDGDIMSLAQGVYTSGVRGDTADAVDAMSLRVSPNPCNPSTLLSVRLPQHTNGAVLSLFGVNGQLVQSWNLASSAGVQRVVWSGHDRSGHAVASGVYLVILRQGSQMLQKQLLLVR